MLNYFRTLRVLYTKELKNRFSRTKRSSYPKFLLVGLPRSGTTLLHTYLNSHPNIFSAGERDIQLVRKELAGSIEQEERITFPPLPAQIQTAGAKILLPHQPNHEIFTFLKDILGADPSIKVIFLKRENILRWLVSLHIARNSKQWSQTNRREKLTVSQKRLELSAHHLVSQLEEISKITQTYQQLFEEANTFELSYESLSANPQPCLGKLQLFLEVRPLPLVSLLQKQNPEPLHALIRNYKEVERILIDSPYQKFLEEPFS